MFRTIPVLPFIDGVTSLKDTEGYGWMNREEYKPIENRDFKNIKDILEDLDLEVTFTTERVNGNFNERSNFYSNLFLLYL